MQTIDETGKNLSAHFGMTDSRRTDCKKMRTMFGGAFNSTDS